MQGGIPKPPEPIMHFNRDDLKGLPFTFPTAIHRYISALHSQTEGVGVNIICSFRKRCENFVRFSNRLFMFFGVALLLVSSLVFLSQSNPSIF